MKRKIIVKIKSNQQKASKVEHHDALGTYCKLQVVLGIINNCTLETTEFIAAETSGWINLKAIQIPDTGYSYRHPTNKGCMNLYELGKKLEYIRDNGVKGHHVGLQFNYLHNTMFVTGLVINVFDDYKRIGIKLDVREPESYYIKINYIPDTPVNVARENLEKAKKWEAHIAEATQSFNDRVNRNLYLRVEHIDGTKAKILLKGNSLLKEEMCGDFMRVYRSVLDFEEMLQDNPNTAADQMKIIKEVDGEPLNPLLIIRDAAGRHVCTVDLMSVNALSFYVE